MRKEIKILIGIATLLPLGYFGLFMANFMAFPDELIAFELMFRLHMFFMVYMVGLMIYYIVNVFNNKNEENNKRALWAIAIFMGHFIAMPIYWYLNIWKENKLEVKNKTKNL